MYEQTDGGVDLIGRCSADFQLKRSKIKVTYGRQRQRLRLLAPTAN